MYKRIFTSARNDFVTIILGFSETSIQLHRELHMPLIIILTQVAYLAVYTI